MHTSVLLRFVALYGLMYGAYGVSSPFMPAFFQRRGLGPEQLGIVFGAGTAIRLISGPLCGRLADVTHALRGVLASCAAVAAVVAVGLLGVASFHALLVVSLLHAAALAPTTTLADALALDASTPRPGGARFEYGWVRGTGSAAFVLGTLLSGHVVVTWGFGSILVLQAVQLTLDMRSLAYFDDAQQAWVAEAGEFEVLVGQSSADLPLRTRFALAAAWTESTRPIGTDR